MTSGPSCDTLVGMGLLVDGRLATAGESAVRLPMARRACIAATALIVVACSSATKPAAQNEPVVRVAITRTLHASSLEATLTAADLVYIYQSPDRIEQLPGQGMGTSIVIGDTGYRDYQPLAFGPSAPLKGPYKWEENLVPEGVAGDLDLIFEPLQQAEHATTIVGTGPNYSFSATSTSSINSASCVTHINGVLRVENGWIVEASDTEQGSCSSPVPSVGLPATTHGIGTSNMVTYSEIDSAPPVTAPHQQRLIHQSDQQADLEASGRCRTRSGARGPKPRL